MKRYLSLIFIFFITIAHAEVEIDITEGTFKPMPIAITNFESSEGQELTQLGNNIRDVVINDLQSSGLFRLVDPAAYIQSTDNVMTKPRFADWRVIQAETLLGGILAKDGHQIRIDFRLFDVLMESQLEGVRYPFDQNQWREVAHKIANAVYERITGDKGYFNTRVAYIAEKGPETRREYRLAIMDQDGFNHQYLTGGNRIIATPRFSYDGKKIAYVDYGKQDKNPNVYIFDLTSGKVLDTSHIPGQKMSARFSPDNSNLIMSVARNGVTSLHQIDLRTQQTKRLTKTTSAIDISACYSPDGSKITYVSDRGGKPVIYVMDSQGGEGERITFGKGSYYTPVWSPRGDLIAFTKINRRDGKKLFYIGVVRPDGTGERVLVEDYLAESPTWSPNGRVLMYQRQSSPSGKKQLYAMDITGFSEHKVDIPNEGDSPSWQPNLE